MYNLSKMYKVMIVKNILYGSDIYLYWKGL